MGNNVDKRGILDQEVFTYRVSKEKKVFISWYHKPVLTLSGAKAAKFLEDMTDAGDKEAQLIMAKGIPSVRCAPWNKNH